MWAVGCIGRGALACSSGSLEAIDIVNCVWPPDCGQRQRLVEVLAGVAETASRQMVRLSRPSLEPRFGHDFSIWKKLQSSRCIHSKQQRTEQNSDACSSVSDNQCGRYGEAPLTDPQPAALGILSCTSMKKPTAGILQLRSTFPAQQGSRTVRSFIQPQVSEFQTAIWIVQISRPEDC